MVLIKKVNEPHNIQALNSILSKQSDGVQL